MQAVYTAGAFLPTPVASCRYFHRSLNPKKLIEVGFSRLAPRMTMARTLKLYKLPEVPQLPGLRRMEERDVAQVTALLGKHLSRFALACKLSEEEVRHWLLSREGVVYSYVIEQEGSGKVTDMLSFYALPSTIIGNKQHPTLRAAYAFYNVATTVSLTALLNDALIVAKQLDFDVFNALNILGNGLRTPP
jgi:glycylpeptide N-tetradecanoyltransferase